MANINFKIYPKETLSHINPEIYGQFSEHLGRCIYGGLYVDGKYNMAAIEALKELEVPVLRWPGGCFADEYHWEDGIGPIADRRRMVNTNWGGTVEDNSFGTHEFLDMCELIGCKPYVALNVGSGTVREAAEWIEYMNSDSDSTIATKRKNNGRSKPWKVEYVGIGNENWGCGGSMEPEYYASEFKKYASFCKDYNETHLYKVACGPNADDYNWTEQFMAHLNKWQTKAISLHYYTLVGGWENKGSALDFDEKDYYTTIQKTLHIEELIEKHLAIMEKYDPEHDVKLIVDEWGTWYDVEPGTNPGFLYQQNTMRDAVVAACNLNIFNRHSDMIPMANIAQAVNVLQCMLLCEGDRVVKTPTYEVFHMFKNHMNGELVKSELDNFTAGIDDVRIPAITHSASVKNNMLTVTLSNASLSEETKVRIDLSDSVLSGPIEITTLTGEVHAHNTFEKPDEVKAVKETLQADGSPFEITLPPCSVVKAVCNVR